MRLALQEFHCMTTTKDGLKALYSATSGASWNSKTNWLSGDPCSSSWFGINCNSAGVVTNVDLDNNGLNGALPTEIGLLTSVRYALDLYHNNIYGFLPTQIGRLTALTSVDVQDNVLSGSVPTEIGLLHNSITNWVHLQKNPKLSGTLPTELGRLTKLSYFFLTSSKLSEHPRHVARRADLSPLSGAGRQFHLGQPSIRGWPADGAVQ